MIEHGVTDEKFFAMCKEPIRLIYELYYEFGDKVTFETGRLTGVPGNSEFMYPVFSTAETVSFSFF